MYKGMANFVQRRRLALAHHLESAKEYTMEGLFYEQMGVSQSLCKPSN